MYPAIVAVVADDDVVVAALPSCTEALLERCGEGRSLVENRVLYGTTVFRLLEQFLGRKNREEKKEAEATDY